MTFEPGRYVTCSYAYLDLPVHVHVDLDLDLDLLHVGACRLPVQHVARLQDLATYLVVARELPLARDTQSCNVATLQIYM